MILDSANFSFVPHAPDPHGNNQDTAEVIYTDPDSGEVIHCGGWMSRHGGNGFRFVHGNPSPSGDAGKVLELAATATTVTVQAGRVNISTL